MSLLYGHYEKKILLIGLDNSGKSTLLYKWCIGEGITTVPTIGFNVETIYLKNIVLRMWDIGGQESICQYWKSYYLETAAIIFVIDSADREKYPSALKEIKLLLSAKELTSCSLLVCANKRDLPNCISISNIVEDIAHAVGKSRRTWTVIETSIFENIGVNEGLAWIAQTLT